MKTTAAMLRQEEELRRFHKAKARRWLRDRMRRILRKHFGDAVQVIRYSNFDDNICYGAVLAEVAKPLTVYKAVLAPNREAFETRKTAVIKLELPPGVLIWVNDRYPAKMRANWAVSRGAGYSGYIESFEYQEEQVVHFDREGRDEMERFEVFTHTANECGHGIHFFADEMRANKWREQLI